MGAVYGLFIKPEQKGLSALIAYINQTLQDDPMIRKITVKSSFSFTLYRCSPSKAEEVKRRVTVKRGDAVGLYARSVSTNYLRVPTNPNRFVINQPDHCLVVDLSNHGVRRISHPIPWLMPAA